MTARIVRGAASPHRLMRRVVLLIALVGLLAPASALASKAGGERLIKDCARDGEINGKYSQGDYKYALSNLPSDLDEYTNCRDAIREAQSAAAGGGSSSGGGGTGVGGPVGGGFDTGSPPVTPSPGAGGRTPPAVPPSAGSSAPVSIGGGPPISPGGPGITAASLTRALPAPLLALLIVLGLGALAGSSRAIRTRVLARRQA